MQKYAKFKIPKIQEDIHIYIYIYPYICLFGVSRWGRLMEPQVKLNPQDFGCTMWEDFYRRLGGVGPPLEGPPTTTRTLGQRPYQEKGIVQEYVSHIGKME